MGTDTRRTLDTKSKRKSTSFCSLRRLFRLFLRSVPSRAVLEHVPKAVNNCLRGCIARPAMQEEEYHIWERS